MDARDLRIGNWIERLFEDESIGIEQCTIRTIWDIFQIETVGESKFQFKPVPLSEELLIKAGFEKAKDNFRGYLISISDDERIRIVNNGFGLEWPLYGNTPVKLEYLHQLQNLYFALTGKELNIEL